MPPGADDDGPPPAAGAWASRHGLLGGALALGVLEAVLISFVPAAALVVVLVALAVVGSSLLFRDAGSTARALRLAVGSSVVAFLICLPWAIGALSSGTGVLAVFGVPTPASGAASWSSLLRFAVGPIGGSPLAVVFRLVLLSILVGVVLAAIGFDPWNILRSIELLFHRIWDLGFDAVNWLWRYFLLGAVIVIPIWLLSRMFGSPRGR